jgi:2-keto-4-pentenoate hydratase/2-oxohepta-3-ene-1,7-dioic acid hydratase in catechol pathway
MKIAQCEDELGVYVGMQLGTTWINYTKAEAAYFLLEKDVALIPRPTIELLLDRGLFSLETFKAVAGFVRKHRLQSAMKLSARACFRAPLARPRKIIGLGLNYVLHVQEGSFDIPDEPIIFMKAGSSVVGPGDAVRIPRNIGRMDHEVELAVVIGLHASEVKKKDAYKYIAGYTILNDVSARSLQTKDLERRHPWFRTKSFDTFTPMGPWIVTTDEIRPPVRLQLECRVNGKIRQKANTRDLLFDIPTIIEFVTRYISLDPGDVISTGTPEGIGPIRGGDVMVCRIAGIGELRNPVVWR